MTTDTASILSLTWQAWFALGIVACTFDVLVSTRLPTDYVFLGGISALLVSGLLDTKQAFAGFSSPGVITVGVLYIVSGLGFLSTLRRARWLSLFPTLYGPLEDRTENGI